MHSCEQLSTALLAPVVDLIFSHLPGGSVIGFLGTLPGSGALFPALLNLPGSGTILNLLGALGVLG